MVAFREEVPAWWLPRCPSVVAGLALCASSDRLAHHLVLDYFRLRFWILPSLIMIYHVLPIAIDA